MGPLSRLWKSVDSVVTALQEESEDPPQLHVRDALSFFEQTVILDGQSHNALQYERRKNIFGAILPGNQTSTTLKEKSEMLSKQDKFLFGKEFQEHIIESLKARKKVERSIFNWNKRRRQFIRGKASWFGAAALSPEPPCLGEIITGGSTVTTAIREVASTITHVSAFRFFRRKGTL